MSLVIDCHKQNWLSLLEQNPDADKVFCSKHSKYLDFRCDRCYMLKFWAEGAADIFEDWRVECANEYIALVIQDRNHGNSPYTT